MRARNSPCERRHQNPATVAATVTNKASTTRCLPTKPVAHSASAYPRNIAARSPITRIDFSLLRSRNPCRPECAPPGSMARSSSWSVEGESTVVTVRPLPCCISTVSALANVSRWPVAALGPIGPLPPHDRVIPSAVMESSFGLDLRRVRLAEAAARNQPRRRPTAERGDVQVNRHDTTGVLAIGTRAWQRGKLSTDTFQWARER